MIEYGAEGIARTCLSVASPAAKMLGIVIMSDTKRATSSLFGSFFLSEERKRTKEIKRTLAIP